MFFQKTGYFFCGTGMGFEKHSIRKPRIIDNMNIIIPPMVLWFGFSLGFIDIQTA